MKFTRVFIILITVQVIFSFSASRSFGYKEPTHFDINKFIAENQLLGFSLDDYIKSQLGFSDGVNEILKTSKVSNIKDLSPTISAWVGLGGEKEDSGFPGWRFLAHFHNPLEPWDDAGYAGFYSSILWAQSSLQYWGWQNVRDYFYLALTAEDQATRDNYLANTFRGVGQLMHLVQDASVPLHTRNDGHIFESFENYVENTRKHEWPKFFSWINDQANKGYGYDESVLNIAPDPFNNGLAPIPIARIVDTDQYSGNNPSITTAGLVGIAEYSNANFFSQDTIFKNLPHPSLNDLSQESFDIIDLRNPSAITKRKYYKRDEGPGIICRIATVPYFIGYPVPGGIAYMPSILDYNVYNDYAERLIPRAVGYSAGLLDYFFRGELHVELLIPSVDQAAFSIGNENDTGTDIDKVAVFLQNKSTVNGMIELIGQGKIILTASFTDMNNGGQSVSRSAAPININEIPEFGSEFFLPVLFEFQTPIYTSNIKDLTYYIVFRGQLGSETDAVIGKVIKAPVLKDVVPNEGPKDSVVTLNGDNLPEINEPFPTTTDSVRFYIVGSDHTVEVTDKTDTTITVKVPYTAGLVKPGYGGIRLRKVLDTGEVIYSNPAAFFPLADGTVKNVGFAPINVTVRALGPILGAYSQKPADITINNLQPGASETIQLVAGYTYEATANTSVTHDFDFIVYPPTFELE